VEEAVSTGAAALATACSGCKKNLAEAASTTGAGLEVFDVLELLERSL
jgi:Fe-S oxidoreductase